MPPKALTTVGIIALVLAVLVSWATAFLQDYEDAATLIQYACVFLGATGVLMALRGLAAWARGVAAGGRRPLRMFPEMVVRNVIPLQRHRPMPLVRDLQNFAPVWLCVLLILLSIFMTVGPLPPQGLLLNLHERKAVGWQKSPWAETMGVYVDGQRKFYVNGKAIAREQLPEKLLEELGRRAVWTVYFEAHSDSVFMDAIYAIDTIQGLGAKVIWITPRMREEWNQRARGPD